MEKQSLESGLRIMMAVMLSQAMKIHKITKEQATRAIFEELSNVRLPPDDFVFLTSEEENDEMIRLNCYEGDVPPPLHPSKSVMQ